MENKSLHDYLVKGHVQALQERLNLKEWLGFAGSHFDFSPDDWKQVKDYHEFVSEASIYPSLVGCVENKETNLKFETTVILYKGRYHVQVEVQALDGDCSTSITSVCKEYLSALQFAYKVVKKGGQTDANEWED